MEDREREVLSLFGEGVWQVAQVVPDLESAIDGYRRNFGVGPWTVYTYKRPFVKEMTYRGQPGNFESRLALARVGPMQLELIQPLKGPSIYLDFVEEHGYGLHHIAVLVDDLDAGVATAEDAGFEVLMDGRGYGVDGDGGFAYLDTEAAIGVILELVELPARRAEPEAVYS